MSGSIRSAVEVHEELSYILFAASYRWYKDKNNVRGDDEGGVIEQIRVDFGEKWGENLVRQIQAAYPSKQNVDCLLKPILFVSHQWDEEVHILILYQPEGSSCFERVGETSLLMQLCELFYTKRLTFPFALRGWAERQVRVG